MCGIGALLDPEGTLGPAAAAAMAGALRHRGPDGEAVRDLGPVHLVHTRLAIIDVAGGDQPLTSEDGAVTVVVNGEIYNHEALRSELEAAGHVFATRSDCEVVVHLYEEHGLDAVRRLNGMFAIALWDARSRRLVVARDPLGVKPLYWWTDGRRLAVASEIGALLATGAPAREVDPVALEHFLAWRFVPAPRTMLASVRKLAAGELLVADGDETRVTSYREAPGVALEGDADELAGELAGRLEAAVRRQMMSDVPYGAFLSGGVDSAAIVASMGRAIRTPQTFTIGFPGQGTAVDERVDAAASARLLGADHRADTLEEAAFPALMDRCVARLEEPCGIPSAPALLQLSGFARHHVKVALSGQGADEPLGGYTRHQAMAVLWAVQRAPGALSRPMRALAGLVPRAERLQRTAGLVGAGDERDALMRVFEIAPAELRGQLSGGELAAQAATERRALVDGVLADVPERGLLEQGLYLDTHLFLPDGLLIYGDKMSMAHGLEQRVPFLDLELLRFVERIPATLRIRHGRRKWLYRRALAGLVPEEIVKRPKRSFSTPYDDWLRTSVGREVERCYASGEPAGELVDGALVAGLVDEHRRGRADHKRLLYCLLELARWHDLFITGDRPVPGREAAPA